MDRPVAAIDVGTNTLLLLVAVLDAKGALTPLVDVHRVPRLGAEVDSRKALHPDAVARTIPVLNEFRAIATSCHASRIIACATSAVRDASNRADFINEVQSSTGLSIEVLTGEEEALWSFHGAISGFPPPGHMVVLDIGGGSTEVIWGDSHCVSWSASLDIGAVRLTERCFHHDPPSPSEINRASMVIDDAIDSLTQNPPTDAQLVAVAGTPTSLATLACGLKTYSQKAVEGYIMPREQIEGLWNNLSNLPTLEIRRLSEVLEGRADVITAGVLILRKVMDRLGFRAMTVSDRGLRYGLALREFQRSRGS